jgi:hypothetical protein
VTEVVEMAKGFRAVETLKQIFRGEGAKVIHNYVDIENKHHLKREEIAEKPERSFLLV